LIRRRNLKKLSELEISEQYQIKIPNRFAALENIVKKGSNLTVLWANSGTLDPAPLQEKSQAVEIGVCDLIR